MPRQTYSEKLLDPRWQKLRLQIFERDEFSCRHCGDAESTLNAHHLRYHKNPWESPTGELITLCRDCHKTVEDLKESIGIQLAEPVATQCFKMLSVIIRDDDDGTTVERLRGILAAIAYRKMLGPFACCAAAVFDNWQAGHDNATKAFEIEQRIESQASE